MAALVDLAREARTPITIDRQENAGQLVLDQRTLLLDNQDFLGTGTGVADKFRVERPGHANAAKTDAELAQPFGVQAKQPERLHDVRLRFPDGHDHQTPPACAGIETDTIEAVGPAESNCRGQAQIEQPPLLFERTVRPANRNIGWKPVGHENRG